MEPLSPSPDQLRGWTEQAVDWMTDYLQHLTERRVYPNTSSSEIRASLDESLPEEGEGFASLLKTFSEVLVPSTRQNAHPRMFGYVQSPGVPIAAIADLLASTLNANVTVWRSAPAAVELERITIDWIRQMLGYPPNAGGLFVSGGSMANLSALAAARHAKAPAISANGNASTRLRLYGSTETHHSIGKAAALLGIGRENFREVAVDARCRVSLDDLRVKIREDKAAGHLPLCVVGNAGTVNTGACDPLRALREIAGEFDLWFHVDGSYGGFAILVPETRVLFDGIEEADSVALDPHKWLYLPVDCGCVMYRDAATARDAFSYEAEYTRIINQQADEAFAYWDYGPELSRRFRALKFWMLLKGVGVRALRESIAKNMACAHHLESLVRASDDFEMLAPVELSIFCFRHVPADFKRALAVTNGRDALNARLDEWNEKLLVALQRDGSSYLSNARVNGRFALRGCVMNYRTTSADMEILLRDLRRVASSLPTISPALSR